MVEEWEGHRRAVEGKGIKELSSISSASLNIGRPAEDLSADLFDFMQNQVSTPAF